MACRPNFLHNRPLSFESLEERRLLAVFQVNQLGDAPVSAAGDAPGTLRQAIFDANQSAGPDVIQFAVGLSGAIELQISDDATFGPTALVVMSEITIEGNATGVTIGRDAAAAEMRLFRVTGAGRLTLESVTLRGGIARGADGTSGANGAQGLGGAIYSEGVLEIVASTLHDNRALGGNAAAGGNGGSGLGGAVYNYEGDVSIINSTISSNTAASGAGGAPLGSFGGGVYSRNGSLAIYNSTVTSNAAWAGRGVYVYAVEGTASLAVYSSIIAQADASIFARDLVVAPDHGGETSVAGADNLIRAHNVDPSISIPDATDPLLGPLGDHGGPTLTHAPAEASQAIDNGANPMSLATDQRGGPFARVIGAGIDIGAFERQTFSGPALPGDYNGNLVVDAADYVLWRKTFGAQVTHWTGADGSGNGEIGVEDYQVWRAGFGGTSAAAATIAAMDSDPGQVRQPVAFHLFYSDRPGRSSNPIVEPLAMVPVTGSAHDVALLAALDELRPEVSRPESAEGVGSSLVISQFNVDFTLLNEITSFASFS